MSMKRWSTKEMILFAVWEIEKLKLKFGVSGRGVRASEVSVLIPSSKPTIYKYLRELVAEGYLGTDVMQFGKSQLRSVAYVWVEENGKAHCEARGY